MLKFKDILAACSTGEMPEVKVIENTGKENYEIGQVTTIKNNGKYLGIGVSFPGVNYEVWFNESDSYDKRSRYIRQLKLV